MSKQELYDKIYEAKKECYIKALKKEQIIAKNNRFFILKEWLRNNKDNLNHYKKIGLKRKELFNIQKERKLNDDELKSLCFIMCFYEEYLKYLSGAPLTVDVEKSFNLLFEPYLQEWNSNYKDFKNIILGKSIF